MVIRHKLRLTAIYFRFDSFIEQNLFCVHELPVPQVHIVVSIHQILALHPTLQLPSQGRCPDQAKGPPNPFTDNAQGDRLPTCGCAQNIHAEMPQCQSTERTSRSQMSSLDLGIVPCRLIPDSGGVLVPLEDKATDESASTCNGYVAEVHNGGNALLLGYAEMGRPARDALDVRVDLRLQGMARARPGCLRTRIVETCFLSHQRNLVKELKDLPTPDPDTNKVYIPFAYPISPTLDGQSLPLTFRSRNASITYSLILTTTITTSHTGATIRHSSIPVKLVAPWVEARPPWDVSMPIEAANFVEDGVRMVMLRPKTLENFGGSWARHGGVEEPPGYEAAVCTEREKEVNEGVVRRIFRRIRGWKGKEEKGWTLLGRRVRVPSPEVGSHSSDGEAVPPSPSPPPSYGTSLGLEERTADLSSTGSSANDEGALRNMLSRGSESAESNDGTRRLFATLPRMNTTRRDEGVELQHRRSMPSLRATPSVDGEARRRPRGPRKPSFHALTNVSNPAQVPSPTATSPPTVPEFRVLFPRTLLGPSSTAPILTEIFDLPPNRSLHSVQATLVARLMTDEEDGNGARIVRTVEKRVLGMSRVKVCEGIGRGRVNIGLRVPGREEMGEFGEGFEAPGLGLGHYIKVKVTLVHNNPFGIPKKEVHVLGRASVSILRS
ncbi:hypothetical protein HDU67_008102 [Dinochytrium kinnereticum]|nr:hypothetical protein HDU67_008102 [Dinochytrium kinnereticum]